MAWKRDSGLTDANSAICWVRSHRCERVNVSARQVVGAPGWLGCPYVLLADIWIMPQQAR